MIANKQAICDVLLRTAENDKDVVVLCSDSRGSGSMTDFADTYPKQFVEVGIAEQSLVSVSAGLAKCGKKAFAVSPACFLSTRSMEQVKVDVAYSKTNVKLIGISGGVSYGALGMTHHSNQDIAIVGSIPGMRVYIPSDRLQTEKLTEALLKDEKPAYIRVGRNPVEDIYTDGLDFELDKAIKHGNGTDVAIIACGEMVSGAIKAQKQLEEMGISSRVIDMYCLKPIDEKAIIECAKDCKVIVTIEEHCKLGGLGSIVSQIVSENEPKKVKSLSLPDAPVVTGNSKEVFNHYNLNEKGIIQTVLELLK